MNGISLRARKIAAWIFGSLSLLLVGAGTLLRGEPVFRTAAGFLSFIWIALIPGLLVLLLLDYKGDRLRFLLLGSVTGLAVVPLVYYFSYLLGVWRWYLGMQSLCNILLGAMVWLRRSAIRLPDFRVRFTPRLLSLAVILFAVAATVFLREMIQLLPSEMVIHSTQEVDRGYFIGLTSGFQQYGIFVNMYDGAVPMKYHHFTYLLWYLLSSASGASLLNVSQVQFPLIFFSLLSLAAYSLTRLISGKEIPALASGLLVLVLQDFSILNPVLGKISGLIDIPVYDTRIIHALHASPSWLIAMFMTFVLMAELRDWGRNGSPGAVGLLLAAVVLPVLAAYKATVWISLVAGMGIASLLTMRRHPRLLLYSLVAGAGGLLLIFFTSYDTARTVAASTLVGYPLLRHDFAQNVLKLPSLVTPAELNLRDLLFMAGLFPVWALTSYGVKLAWFFRKRVPGADPEPNLFFDRVIFASIVLSVVVAMTFGLGGTPENTFYMTMFTLTILTPLSLPVLAAHLSNRGSRKAGRLLAGALLLVQASTGALYVVKPMLKNQPITVLSAEWLAGMRFLKEHSRPEERVLSNRYNFSTDPESDAYNERFYFVSAVTERAMAVSGNRYPYSDGTYNIRRREADSLFAAADPAGARALAKTLRVSFIIEERRIGRPLACRDTSFVEQVYENGAMRIYHVQ